VIDLGAGEGALTLALLDRGARVLAIELHPGRADTLRRRIRRRASGEASVLLMDAATFRYPGSPVRVVANPPFGMAVALLRVMTRSPSVRSADVVLPAPLVTRLLSDRRLARWRASRGLWLPPGAFRPSAPGPCAVLRLRRPAG
jgi:23S rRNA (adenine-N6)-dimethyltransferase